MQDSQRTTIDAPSPSKRKKKKNDRTLHAAVSDVERQSGNEHEPSDNVNDDVSYVSVVSTFPNTFALVLDSNLHDLNGTNPD